MSGARLVYCHCAYARVVPDETKRAVLRELSDSGAAFDAVPDLCEMAARKDPALARLAQGAADGELRIAACYPRAVRWLFHGADAPLPDGARVLNMRTDSAGSVCARLFSAEPLPPEPEPEPAEEAAGEVAP